jgi:hypothetical protein
MNKVTSYSEMCPHDSSWTGGVAGWSEATDCRGGGFNKINNYALQGNNPVH